MAHSSLGTRPGHRCPSARTHLGVFQDAGLVAPFGASDLLEICDGVDPIEAAAVARESSTATWTVVSTDRLTGTSKGTILPAKS